MATPELKLRFVQSHDYSARYSDKAGFDAVVKGVLEGQRRLDKIKPVELRKGEVIPMREFIRVEMVDDLDSGICAARVKESLPEDATTELKAQVMTAYHEIDEAIGSIVG